MTPTKMTALNHVHLRTGAIMAVSDGWMRPERYSDAPEKEAEMALQGAGVSDICPLSKTDVKGTAMDEYLEMAFTREFAPTRPGEVKMIGSPGASGPGVPPPPSPPSSSARLIGYVCRLTSDHSLVVSQPDARSTSVLDPEAGLLPPTPESRVYLTNVTSTLAGVNLVGPASTGILGKLTRLDVSPRRGLPSPGCAEGGFAGVYALIVRSDVADGDGRKTASFDIYFGRDYAEYVWESIMDAGREFGIKPFGVAAHRLIHAGGAVR